jgi:hypothetical protein
MKTTLLVLPISLLPSIMAQWWIRILVPDDWKDETIVWGKNTSEGVSVEQSRAKHDPESGSLCPPLGDCNITYAGITWLQFSKSTVDPRPINITMGGELLQVSLGPDSVFTAETVVRNHYTTKQ